MEQAVAEGNKLFPVFLKTEQLRLLIVGGGAVGMEKLNALLQNAPETPIRLVAIQISAEIRKLSLDYKNLDLHERAFKSEDLDKIDLVLVAINDPLTSGQVASEAKHRGKLVNVADKPELCDFYLGSIVRKGDLKIAISTNGKSPTLAKRLREVLSESIPDSMQQVLDQLQTIRKTLSGDFTQKVDKLNDLTKILVESPGSAEDFAGTVPNVKPLAGLNRAWWIALAFFFMILGGLVFHIQAFTDFLEQAKTFAYHLNAKFYWMVLTGFSAQIIAGALGMGYGVICTTILLSLGINLPAISSSIHTAETFASGVSGYSHYKFGNVNKKLFRALLLPGVLGAISGAVLLSLYGDKYANYIRPILALYTLFLGVKILLNAFQNLKIRAKVRNIPLLAAAGGFIDSFGGGGWGPLITSSFIASGRTPRFVVGSVSLTKFFVSLASALTFFSMLGVSHWEVIAGLLLGGITAAPLSAKLAGLLPTKLMFISVGVLVILCSLRLLLKSFWG